MALFVVYSPSGLFTFHRLAFILWSLRGCHFLSLGLLLAATRFLDFIPLLNLPKIGGHEFDQWQFFLICVLKTAKLEFLEMGCMIILLKLKFSRPRVQEREWH